MIVVTGGAGFIGSNLVRGLNREGHEDVVVVDELTDGRKFENISDCKICDYLDKDEFMALLQERGPWAKKIRTVFHQGACAVTTEWDGRYMMENNYTYSKRLLDFCLNRDLQFIYASSAAVYGTGVNFAEDGKHEKPVNVYAYSKYLFDEYVRNRLDQNSSQIAGLRYFNVYGPRERYKAAMASVIFHFNFQNLKEGKIRLFKGSGGYEDGEQRRDFIYVDDVVDVNLWMMRNTDVSGIFNVGTGTSRSFNDVARAVVNWHGRGDIHYIDFPEKLKDSYQSFTQADISALQKAGYSADFTDLDAGVRKYLDWMNR